MSKMENISNLITKLDSGLPWIRKRAQKRIIEIGLPAVNEIIAALDTRFAPIAIGGFKSGKDGYSELNSALRRYPLLVDALVKIGKPALAELENALEHPNPNVRICVLRAIGNIGHPSAVDIILPYLEAAESYESGWAIVSLGCTRSPKVYETIITALDNRTVDEFYTIEALGELGDIRASPKLEQIAASYQNNGDPRYVSDINSAINKTIKKIQKRNDRNI
jgi:HEAT repeat protein